MPHTPAPLAARLPKRYVGFQSTSRSDFPASLFAIFSGLALLMSAVGIYGLMAYSAARGIGNPYGAQRVPPSPRSL